MKKNKETRKDIKATNCDVMKPNIEISDNYLKEVATLLNTLLADEYILYTKTRNAHWNVQGAGFMELHAFFQSQYEVLDIIIDDVAERVRSLGHFALGSLKNFLNVTHMLENDDDFGNQKQIIQTLVNDHETIIRIMRNDLIPVSDKYKDLGTTDFLTGVMKQHEKMTWMLRAYLG
jgi:starvation-inducible DNA-binding protein